MSVTEDFSPGSAEMDGSAESVITWHESAPPSIAAATGWKDGSDGWKAWRKHLAGRKFPLALSRLLRTEDAPLLWGWPSSANRPIGGQQASDSRSEARDLEARDIESGDIESVVRRLLAPDELAAEPQWLQDEAVRWRAEMADDPSLPAFALKSLAWAHVLPAAAAILPADEWWYMLGELVALASEAGDARVENELSWQLLAGELALTLAYLFPEIATCRQLLPAAMATIGHGFDELLDGKGMPRFAHLSWLRAWLACWTRARAMSETLDAGWKKKLSEEYARLVRHGLRLAQCDGSPVLSESHRTSADRELFRVGVRMSDDRDNQRIATAVFGKEALKPRRLRNLPSSAAHSEWSEIGVLRTDWSPTSPRLTVGYGQQKFISELDCGRELLWSGSSDPQVRFNGAALVPTSDWKEVCWVSDEDVDYLELEISLGDSIRVERQMLLAREDGFLLWADAILAQAPGDIEYQCELPLVPGVRFEGAEDTREGRLVGRKARAMILPLALPEWRQDPRVGALESDASGRLVLRQSTAAGRGLFAPLFIDLNRKRFSRKLTWRRLTVAENREVQPNDLTAGYRIQIGDEQWLVYRSLNGAANRTVLGHHLLTQFLAGRFSSEGEVRALLEIE